MESLLSVDLRPIATGRPVVETGMALKKGMLFLFLCLIFNLLQRYRPIRLRIVLSCRLAGMGLIEKPLEKGISRMTNITDLDTPRTLGERMRARRLEKGWTQEQLARRAGTNQAVIQKIENGKSLRPRKIDKIAEELGVSPSWLMFGEDGDVGLEPDAILIAEQWSRLPEPHRSRIRDEIRILTGSGGESTH